MTGCNASSALATKRKGISAAQPLRRPSVSDRPETTSTLPSLPKICNAVQRGGASLSGVCRPPRTTGSTMPILTMVRGARANCLPFHLRPLILLMQVRSRGPGLGYQGANREARFSKICSSTNWTATPDPVTHWSQSTLDVLPPRST